ncbi:MAG: (2Fe-2S)-binding protein, partial [Spirochaetales bacterium]|nr:(2Fe-2S)-binding protein [Spirochaetales bacterium]
MKITFSLNGKKMTIETEPLKPLVTILRNDLGLTGTKFGCGKGECGSCLVFMNQEIVNSCLVPAFKLEGTEIKTIEKFSQSKEYTLLEEAITTNHAIQCGFCAPGVVMAAGDLLSHSQNPGIESIKDTLSGNKCRCSGYREI